MQNAERTLNGYDVHVDFSKRDRKEILNGFFNERGVIDVLKEKVYSRIDILSPFMEAFVDRLCALDSKPITSSHVKYLEVVHAIYRYGRGPGRIAVETQELCKMIMQFKENYLGVFARNQVSELQKRS